VARMAKSGELSLGGVNGEPTCGKPASAELEIFPHQAGGLLMGIGASNQHAIVHIELSQTPMPTLCQAEEGGGVEGGEDGG
jgi:hypothetical protein